MDDSYNIVAAAMESLVLSWTENPPEPGFRARVISVENAAIWATYDVHDGIPSILYEAVYAGTALPEGKDEDDT